MKKKKWIQYIIYTVIFIIFLIVFYNIVSPSRDDYSYQVFNIYSNDMFPGDFYRHNNLFRYLLDICHYLNFDLRLSASVILSMLVLIRFIFFFSMSNRLNIVCRTLLSLALCLIMTISFGPVGQIYMGKFAGNVWHNSPYIAMMAFAPLCVYYFMECFVHNQDSKIKLVFLSLSMLLCVLSKPNFVIACIPSCAIYLLLDFSFFSKDAKKLRSNIIKGLLVSGPALLFLGCAYILEFNSGSNHIIFDFFGVWSNYAGRKLNVLFNFIVSSLPGLMIIIKNKDNNKEHLFYLILLCVGVIYFSFFAESETYYHANFAWTYASCSLIFNSFLLIDYFTNNIKCNKTFSLIIVMLLVLSCFTGIRYVVALMNNVMQF